MTTRTFAIGDIHGDLEHLERLFAKLPPLTGDDTLVFVGDYVDRGPNSAGVVRYLMELPDNTPAKVVCLRGNHEDGWLRTIDEDWLGFTLPVHNGCLQAMESFLDLPISPANTFPTSDEHVSAVLKGTFFPPEVVAWMRDLLWWYEDKYAIYVHAGLPSDGNGGFMHPSETSGETRTALAWTRNKDFLVNYRGKVVVFGHTLTDQLPPELSSYTPEDDKDLWAGPAVVGLDTGCGKGGFLTAAEFPAMHVYESR